jgi:glycosyltransferase involved in cell wall biosynthesis
MMKAPLVTVAIPFFNAQRSLGDAIRSVFAQTFHDWELLLVDDGSSDRSLRIARSVLDRRVRVFSDGKNRGLSCRLNQIADLARGDFAARMDADDLMHPRRLERQLEFLGRHPDVQVLGTAMIAIDGQSRPLGLRGNREIDSRASSVLKGPPLAHPTVLARTSWFRENPYDGAYVRAEDHELWVRTWARTVFDRIPEPLLFYREEAMITLGKYLSTCRSGRKIILDYGAERVGWSGVAALLLRSKAKEWAYRVFALLGRLDVLLARRSAPLPAGAAEEAAWVIRSILATPVPGMAA